MMIPVLFVCCCGLLFAAQATTAVDKAASDQSSTKLAIIPAPTSPSISLFSSSSPVPISNIVTPSFWPHQAPVDATTEAPFSPTSLMPTTLIVPASPADEPCTLNGLKIAKGELVATATKGDKEKDKEIEVLQKFMSYYDGSVSFKISYKAKFRKDGSFESGTCDITLIYFTNTNPDRKFGKRDVSDIVVTDESFQTIPMTEAKKDKDCTKVESFTCEGGPWIPKDDVKKIELMDKCKLKGAFDLKKDLFEIPTCEFSYKENDILYNFVIMGGLDDPE